MPPLFFFWQFWHCGSSYGFDLDCNINSSFPSVLRPKIPYILCCQLVFEVLLVLSGQGYGHFGSSCPLRRVNYYLKTAWCNISLDDPFSYLPASLSPLSNSYMFNASSSNHISPTTFSWDSTKVKTGKGDIWVRHLPDPVPCTISFYI